jgi:periplasmic copper chaperone A
MNVPQRLATAALVAVLSLAPAFAADAPTVRDAWARATPPGAGVAAVYLTVAGGARADRIVAASTDRAAMTEIHEVTEQQGVSRMRPVTSVDVPAGREVVFAPQGLHLMLMGIDAPLVAGERFEVELQFEHAGAVRATVEVRAVGAGHAH